ncbi:MAG: ribose 5-phosphate isomerase B [Clostridia bacterium]|nr:ribose 5-phosphate isomerase B [Clostridia bacterium]
MIAIGCDHGGFALKEAVKKHLEAKGIEVKDFGCYSTDSVDYAVHAAKVAHCVADGEAEYGVLVCSTGIGISMAANKVKGIRAALCCDTHAAEMTRRHNNANILCMGGLVISEEMGLNIVDTFLSFEFEGGRHQRRVDQIAAIENGEL